MEPSAQFLKKVANNPNALRLIDRCKKEFEIFSYLSDMVPKALSDKEWSKLLTTKSVDERVTLWIFAAKLARKEEREAKAKEEYRQKLLETREKQEEIFNNGGMAYGPGFYRSMLNPLSQMKDRLPLITDVEHYITWKLKDTPEIAFDLQYIPNESYLHGSRLSTNLQHVLSQNRDSKFPLPLSLVNVDSNEARTKNFIKDLGMFNSETGKNCFRPPVLEDNPLLIANQEKTKDIVYISRHGKDILDGPLVHDAYIIPVTFDHKNNSLAGARRGNFKLMSLPFRKYIKWQSGPMFLPLTGIYNVLKTVSQTGGDWHRALSENVSKRHLEPQKEIREDIKAHHDIVKFRAAQRLEVIAAIKEALGEN